MSNAHYYDAIEKYRQLRHAPIVLLKFTWYSPRKLYGSLFTFGWYIDPCPTTSVVYSFFYSSNLFKSVHVYRWLAIFLFVFSHRDWITGIAISEKSLTNINLNLLRDPFQALCQTKFNFVIPDRYCQVSIPL